MKNGVDHMADRWRKVVFLDIDGVLQPFGSKNRFGRDLDVFREDIARERGAIYREIDKYDVAAVALDWDLDSVDLLRQLLDEEPARLVIESSWREFHPAEHLLALFAIHGLDSYIDDVLPDGPKQDVIVRYLEESVDIFSYVVLDDGIMSQPVGARQVVISRSLDEGDIAQARLILSRGIGR